MQTFVAYTNALELVRMLVPIVAALKKHSAEQSGPVLDLWVEG